MVIYGVAILAGSFMLGQMIGEMLGSWLGIDANVGGVGFAMVLPEAGRLGGDRVDDHCRVLQGASSVVLCLEFGYAACDCDGVGLD